MGSVMQRQVVMFGYEGCDTRVAMVRVGELGFREGSKRDSSAVQADSFADEPGEKASACSGRNDRSLAILAVINFW